MVDKKQMTTAVSDLEQELSTFAREDPKQPVEDACVNPQTGETVETGEDAAPGLQDVEHLLEQHGLDADELKGIWEHFLEELKDLPSKKPLVTVFGAFLLGFIAGRSSRK